MEFNLLSDQLACNAERIRGLLHGVSDEQARWRPDSGSWSMLEVVNHLYDEEKEDFPVRLTYILYHAGESWPPIDPEGWVASRHYNERDPRQSLARFLSARTESLAWLNGLVSPDWEAGVEVSWGRMTAGDMLASWVAHDLLHMRQLVELQRAYAARLVGPYRTDYAGAW